MKNDMNNMEYAQLSKEELEILKETEEKLNKKRQDNKVILLALS